MLNLFFRKKEDKKTPERWIRPLNAQNFKSDILARKGISLVEFYADWCMPCKIVEPVLEQIALERNDIVVGKINIEKETALTSAYGIISVPTLIVFKGGNVYKRIVGVRSKRDILAVLERKIL